MTAKCTRDVHFRLHMYANSTWLDCSTENDKPCADGVHVQPEMNVTSTFCGGGDGWRRYTCLLYYLFSSDHRNHQKNPVESQQLGPPTMKHKIIKINSLHEVVCVSMGASERQGRWPTQSVDRMPTRYTSNAVDPHWPNSTATFVPQDGKSC